MARAKLFTRPFKRNTAAGPKKRAKQPREAAPGARGWPGRGGAWHSSFRR